MTTTICFSTFISLFLIFALTNNAALNILVHVYCAPILLFFGVNMEK